MKIHFLGTGTSQGVPVIGSTDPVCLSHDPRDKRLRVAVWVEWEGASIVVDCGPDFRYQMLRSGCSRLDALLFTHEHADHTAGLDDIRPYYFKQGPIDIYAELRVMDNLAQRFDYIFSDVNKYPGAPSVNKHVITPGQTFQVKGLPITPIRLQHGPLPIVGYRMGNFAYLTDVKAIAEEQFEQLQNLDVLVLSALRHEPHPMHFNLEEALACSKMLQPKNTYLTHISHHMGFHAEQQNNLPAGVFLAYDTLAITI